MAPGECIVHDHGGEFTSKLQKKLAKAFGVELRCIQAGRPWANGQAESAVKKVKDKIKLLGIQSGEYGDKFPQEWDGPFLQNVLQILRCDPTQATGFAPAELMIGRPLVYPIQFSRAEIDYSGTTMTTPLVQKLIQIRRTHFALATKKIKKAQDSYKKQYDKKMKAKPFGIKIGDKVQYWRYKSKNTLSKKDTTRWCPIKNYHLVLSLDYEKQRCVLQDINGKKLERTHPFSRLRKFRG